MRGLTLCSCFDTLLLVFSAKHVIIFVPGKNLYCCVHNQHRVTSSANEVCVKSVESLETTRHTLEKKQARREWQRTVAELSHELSADLFPVEVRPDLRGGLVQSVPAVFQEPPHLRLPKELHSKKHMGVFERDSGRSSNTRSTWTCHGGLLSSIRWRGFRL